MFVTLLSSLTSVFSAKWKRMEANTSAVLATSRLHMYKGLVCSSLGVFVRHLWVQERALPWPCNQGLSALCLRNAFFGSLSQCFSLWAALLRLKAEQHRNSTLRVFFILSCHPKGIKRQIFYFLSILNVSYANVFWLQSIVQRSTLGVTALGQEQNLSTQWVVLCIQAMISTSCVRRGWEHSCAFRSSSALRSTEGTWWAGAALHGLFCSSQWSKGNRIQ